MNTKLIMTISAVFLALAGVSLTFFPNEIANQIGLGSAKPAQLVIQILGALYFGFAMLNWTAKGSIIGGIYNKPLVIGNLSHFLIGGLALIKGLTHNGGQSTVFMILAGVYTVFAILFGILFVRHPENSPNS
jgi:hypothetical protein